jgi:hypothetical protein
MRSDLRILTLTLGAIACTDRTAPTSGPLASQSFTGSTLEPTDNGVERAFRELSRVAPSHGGWYFDTLTGDLNVYLKDMTEGPATKGALPSLMSQGLARTRARHPQAGIVFKQGTYTFIELARWRDALNDFFFETSSVHWWGIDHARNQLIVGVLSGADSQAIVAKALELGVPEGALRLERTGRFQPLQTLRDSIRPIKGGILLEHEKSPTLPIQECTLGFLALWGGEHAFVTASHCSSQELALDSTKQFQPHWHALPQNASSIGFEVADATTSCRCDPFVECRCSYADAAVYRATLPPGDWYFKRIARTVSGCSPSCTPPAPLTIDAARPFWSIVRTDTLISVGDLVSKIGITTGWTQSFVREACMTVKRNVTYLCQAYSDFQTEGGDSGSPVLLDILGGTDTTVTLGGILSGTVVGGPNDGLSVFSPWSGILRMYPGLRVN